MNNCPNIDLQQSMIFKAHIAISMKKQHNYLSEDNAIEC